MCGVRGKGEGREVRDLSGGGEGGKRLVQHGCRYCY